MGNVWSTGHKCHVPNCSMTLVAYIGGGMYLCWLHVIQLGLEKVVEAPKDCNINESR